jgi:hypothetical protein
VDIPCVYPPMIWGHFDDVDDHAARANAHAQREGKSRAMRFTA